jgi:outer membrane biogenesis lipoprotein LolB
MRAALAAAGLLLASCAITPEPAKLPELDTVPASFEMIGRLAVRQGDRSDIAKLRWTHERARDTWVISSPLGNEVARIESGDAGATLQRGGAAPETAPDFRSLTERLLGVALDPRQLANWLHSPLGGISTGGWDVEVKETQKAGAVSIARLIVATRGEVAVRLVVDDYRALGN